MNNRQLIVDRGVRFCRFAGTLHLMIYTEPKEDRNYKTMHFDIDDILIIYWRRAYTWMKSISRRYLLHSDL